MVNIGCSFPQLACWCCIACCCRCVLPAVTGRYSGRRRQRSADPDPGDHTTHDHWLCGKASALKKLSTDSGISHLFSITSCETASTTDIGQAGSHLVVLLYGGRVGVDSLNHLHYTTYMRLCTTSKGSICPEQLPPTERAMYFHSLRVHLQVIHGSVCPLSLQQMTGAGNCQMVNFFPSKRTNQLHLMIC